jgi:uncharacterized membrane protein YgdD (TMEM256/DUF423 family)
MRPKHLIFTGAVLAAAAVALGAYGAHGLEKYLAACAADSRDIDAHLERWNSAVLYHLVHAVAIVLLGVAARNWKSPLVFVAGVLFLTGVALFSGCLYLFVMADVRALVHLVPLGGAAFIAGWVALAVAAARQT